MTSLTRALLISGFAIGVLLSTGGHAEAAVCTAVPCSPTRARRQGQPPTTIVGATSTTADADASPTPADGSPSIIRRPGEEAARPANTLGVLVGAVLFVAWIGGGALMFRRAHKRHRA